MQALLTSIIQLVAMLFAAFGAFLTDIAPPGGAVEDFAQGFASFMAVLVFLFIKASFHADDDAVRRRNKFRRVGGLTLVAYVAIGLYYGVLLNTLTFSYPPNDPAATTHVAGLFYSDDAKKFIEIEEGKGVSHSNASLLGEFGSDPQRVWPLNSIELSRLALNLSYSLLIFILMVAIGSLCEVALLPDEKAEDKIAPQDSGASNRTADATPVNQFQPPGNQ